MTRKGYTHVLIPISLHSVLKEKAKEQKIGIGRYIQSLIDSQSVFHSQNTSLTDSLTDNKSFNLGLNMNKTINQTIIANNPINQSLISNQLFVMASFGNNPIKTIAGWEGFEPTAVGLRVRRSACLSYQPKTSL